MPKKEDIIQAPVLRVMRREFRRISERKTLYMLMILLPMALFLLLAGIYKNRVVTDLPMVVYDADHSALSRLIIRSVDATRSMKVTDYAQSVDGIRNSILSGRAAGAVYIPDGTEAAIKSGKPATVIFYKNTSNLIIGNVILKDAMKITNTLSTGILIKKFRAAGMSPQQAMNRANPIRLEIHSLFNPAYNYENFLIPGLLPVMLQMIIMVVAVLVFSAELQEGTLPELFRVAENRTSAVLIGKSIPHLAIHSAMALGMIGIIFPLFGIPVHSSPLILIPYFIYFIMAAFFVGILLSCLFKDLMLATEAAVFLNTPAFIFSGYTYPVEAMPGVHQWYARIQPFYHFLNGFIKLGQMGAPLRYIWPEIGVLSLFLWPALILSAVILHRRCQGLQLNRTNLPGGGQK